MRKVFASLIAALLLNGCANDATVRPQLSDVVGAYYNKDGIGTSITMVLNSDGTFASDWQGCLGDYGDANGVWRLEEMERQCAFCFATN